MSSWSSSGVSIFDVSFCLTSCPVSLLPISKQLQMILFQDCFFLSLPRNTNISSHYWQRHEIKVKQLNNPLKKRYLWAAEDIFLPIRSIQIFVCLSGLYIRWQIRKCISSSFCYFLFSLCCFRSSFTDSEREQNNYYYWKKHVWHLNIAFIGTELKYKVSDCLSGLFIGHIQSNFKLLSSYRHIDTWSK